MMTYNRPYYEKLLSTWGLAKVQDLFAYDGHVEMIAHLDPKLEFVIKEIKRRFNVVVRQFNPKKFDEEVNLFLEIYNRALVGTWGFVPMSPGEVAQQAKGLKHLLIPELTTIIEVDGKPIGAGLGLLDYTHSSKKIDGRLFPFGFLTLLLGKRKLKRVRLMSTNIIPEFQKWGFGLLALERMLPDAAEVGHHSRRVLVGTGVKPSFARQSRTCWSSVLEDLPRLRSIDCLSRSEMLRILFFGAWELRAIDSIGQILRLFS